MSSRGQSPSPGPRQIRTWRFPPSGSSADTAHGSSTPQLYYAARWWERKVTEQVRESLPSETLALTPRRGYAGRRQSHLTETIARLATGSGGLTLDRAGFVPAGRQTKFQGDIALPPIPIDQQGLVALFCLSPEGSPPHGLRRDLPGERDPRGGGRRASRPHPSLTPA